MAALPEIGVVIKAKDEATPVLKRVQETTKQVDQGFKLLNPTLLGVSIGFTAIVGAVTNAVTEFAKSELAIKKVSDALKVAGVFSVAYSEHLQKVASSLQDVTRFSDEQVAGVQQLLITFKVYGKTLDAATKATLDIAETLGIDAESAARMMGKAVEGNTTALKQYGIEVDDRIPKNQKFAEALRQIQKIMGGRAEGAGDTLIGGMDQLRNAMSDAWEQVGKLITSGGILASVFKTIAKEVKDLTLALGGGSEFDQLQRRYGRLNKSLAELQSGIRGSGPGVGADAAEVEKQLDAVAKRMREITAEETKAVEQAQKKFEIKQSHIRDLKEELDILRKRNELEAKRIKYIDEVAANYKKLLDSQNAARLNAIAGGITAASGSAGGLANIAGAGIAANFGAAAGVASGIGDIAEAATELVINSKDLPVKIKAMISDLAQGIAEGIPILINYLSSEFIPDLVNGIATALSGLVKNLPGMALDAAKLGVRSSLALISGGLSEIGGAIFGGLFGGDDRSPQEKLNDTIKALTSAIVDMNRGLRETAQGMIFAVRSIGAQAVITNGQIGINNARIGAASADFLAAGRAGDTEGAAAALQRLNELQKEGLQLQQQAYNVRNKQLDEELTKTTEIYNTQKAAQESLRTAALAQVGVFQSLKSSALSAINSARESILGSTLGPQANVARLQADFASAGTPEARSAAAGALAGGLQAQFAAAQNLAASGAITGEEFNRIQTQILSQLNDVQGQTVSDFDKLINAQQLIVDRADKQIALLDSGFKAFQKSIDKQREEATAFYVKQLQLLSNINNGIQGTTASKWNLSSYKQNIGNQKGVIGTRI